MSVKVTIVSPAKSRISINKQDKSTIRTVGIVPSKIGPENLVDLKDVDASDVDNNETLVYDEVSGKFVVKDLPISFINGGTF